MLARSAPAVPADRPYLYEPKWDGFRAIVFRGAAALYIQSRDLRPLDRYFPELHEALLDRLPPGVVVDGEIVIAGPDGLDFDALQMRLHPAASRVKTLAARTPASFVAFDLLAIDGADLRESPQEVRRARLEALLAGGTTPPLHLTPATRDVGVAVEWLARFEGAGLDGVMAKATDAPYTPGKRTLVKVKHARTADCVVAGFRWHAKGRDELVGSLLLGLYDAGGTLHHVGVTSAFTTAVRRQLAADLAPLRVDALKEHPWAAWASPPDGTTRMPGGHSRWSAGKDLSWEPLRVERVCEVKYDHMQGTRFRHAAIFQRWRPDKPPSSCGYDQLEVTAPYELAKVFGAGASRR
ncbi:MAG: ATP-dependent DNA ligase [Vicinamibacterales bacterium]